MFRSRAIARLILVSCALAPMVWAGSSVAHARGPIVVRVRVGRAVRRIPGSFLGLSMEMEEFNRYADLGPVLRRVFTLVRSGQEPLNLRLGGRSADETLWNTRARHPPPWTFHPGRKWLARLARVARRDQLHITLGLNLWARSPSMASRFAGAALKALGRSRLVGVAIGNEPDLYRSAHLLAREQLVASLAHGASTPLTHFSPEGYRHDYQAYARALARTAPHLPLLGPEMTRPALSWFSPLAHLHRFRPQSLTVHRYPLSSCWPKTTFEYPRLSSMLSNRASDGLAAGLHRAVALARRTGTRLLVSEINSASCNGRSGVTNTFASGLWAPDALLALARAGVAGVNWHMRPGKLNAPFLLRGTKIAPLPELYGLALFARTAVPGARLARVSSTPRLTQALRVWAVRSPQELGVLLINKGVRGRKVELLGATAGTAASVQRLTAPSIRSRHRIRLDGQWIGADARWHGAAATQSVPSQDGRYDVMVPPHSAALVQVMAATR